MDRSGVGGMTGSAPARDEPAMVRSIIALVLVVCGLAAIHALFGVLGWTWLLWIVLGLLAGIVAGRPRRAGWAIAALVVWRLSAELLELPRDQGPFWWVGATASALALVVAFLLGALLTLRQSPLGAAASWWSGIGSLARRVTAVIVALALIGLSGYTVYAGQAGSSEFLHPAIDRSDCRTPDLLGWVYEAVNYDLADDRRLAAANSDRSACLSQGQSAGADVVTRDGIRLAAWYVPAVEPIGPSGPTLVVVHGFRSNKSGGLKYGLPFHQDYNLLIPDLRNSGRSTGETTTMGLLEKDDLRAMIDWLERTKRPTWIGLVGNSMGGATALAEAADDPRVRAVIADSTHAEVSTSIGNVLETEHGHPALPGSWAIIIGVSMAVGGDVSGIDPARTIARLGDRRVLLIHGTRDLVDPPEEAAEVNFHAALRAGVDVELQYCLDARHGEVIDTCPDDWASWALGFLERARAG